ncbi:serine hydrolase domain-containing protein [Pseudoalteromonas umbrosa]|uniref:serine hydrolase domain-containing protein n=1 Tax=Pseudoalteromonas umbrosa TaxID=3048489 RepID=UPI0024C28461|nr:serine hydrolase domain-containing protein [Pseudoalteromonas sp. B95]MDK1285782.1 serine hydrolase domain-containing protein [Pseudoalteromonas sp. B95]
MNKYVLNSLIFLITCFQFNIASAESWPQASDYFQSSLSKLGIVGGSAVFISNQGDSKSIHFGMADIDKGYPITDKTLYHWASITKTFTGIAIMQLRDQQKLKLSDPIIQYLPEITQFHNPYQNTGDITIEHLLTHSAGFRMSSFPFKTQSWQPHEPAEFSQLVAMFPYSEIKFNPGTQYSYSNLGINFLGEIIKRITGDSIESYIDKNIFKPLEMHTAYFNSTPFHLSKYRSNNYAFVNGKFMSGGPEFNTGITSANGGINASITDMTKYVLFLIGDDKKPIYDDVLKRTSLLEMWAPRLTTGTGKHQHIGLTFFNRQIYKQTYIGHTGSQKNFYSSMFINPEAKTGHLFVYNTSKLVPNQDGIKIATTMPTYRAIQSKLFGIMKKQHN